MLNSKRELSITLKYKSERRQLGVSLFLTIIIMTILLAMVLGLSTIFLGQAVMLREMGYSVIAFYAADAGIEQILMNRGSPTSNLSGYLDLNNSNTRDNDDSFYEVIVTASGSGGSGCTAANYCIKSIGTYKGIKRAIEITY